MTRPGAMMKAAVLRCVGSRLSVEDVCLTGPGAGELRVRVEAAGVCHTELHYMDGDMTCPLPIVLGHEGVGVVLECGDGVTDVAVGDRVAFTWRPRCGQCEYCVIGKPVMCVYGGIQARSGGLMDGTTRIRDANGAEVHHFLGVSCYAQEAIVSRQAAVPVSSGVSAQIAAVVGCAVATGVGAVVNAATDAVGSLAGRTVLIIGAGGVGLSAVMGAHLVGAARIVVLDVATDKLELAGRLGASDAVDVSTLAPERVLAAVSDITKGGAHVAVDAVGTPTTLTQAIAAIRPGGTAVAVGLSSANATVAIPINELVQQQKRVIGSLYGSTNPQEDLPRLLRLYEAGLLPLDLLLGGTYEFACVARAFDDLRDGAVGRAVVLPNGGSL